MPPDSGPNPEPDGKEVTAVNAFAAYVIATHQLQLQREAEEHRLSRLRTAHSAPVSTERPASRLRQALALPLRLAGA
jgi:hypothetical protein